MVHRAASSCSTLQEVSQTLAEHNHGGVGVLMCDLGAPRLMHRSVYCLVTFKGELRIILLLIV